MLVNLTGESFENLPEHEKSDLARKFGSILDINLAKINDDKELNAVAGNYFLRTTAALDSCANEPKAVLMNNETKLEKLLKHYFEISKIEMMINI